MPNERQYKVPVHFEQLYSVISSAPFLKKEGLGGELPFFIHSFPVSKQQEVEVNIQSLIKRLQHAGIEVLEINLYQLCIDLLKRENLFDQIIQQEKKLPKQRLIRVLSGPLNIETAIIPEVERRLKEQPAKVSFVTGVGAAFPIIRSHAILNNLQTLASDSPVVLFFPGTYNNRTLTLFDRLRDDNYYRAHNINEYKM